MLKENMRDPLMTGAQPRGHRRMPLGDSTVVSIHVALRAAKVKGQRQDIIERVSAAVDQFRQVPLKARILPKPSEQLENAKRVIEKSRSLLKSLEACDCETNKRVRNHYAKQTGEKTRRKRLGSARRARAIESLEQIIEAHKHARERAKLYVRRGRSEAQAGMVTLATDLCVIWENVAGALLMASRNAVPANGRLSARGAPERYFFEAILRDALGGEVAHETLTHLLQVARKRATTVICRRSQVGANSGDDRFDDIVDSD